MILLAEVDVLARAAEAPLATILNGGQDAGVLVDGSDAIPPLACMVAGPSDLLHPWSLSLDLSHP